MATKEKTETVETVQEEYEEILIPRAAANEDPNLFVGINGVNYILPKGKKSKVPKAVADEIRRSWEAQMTADDRIQQMSGTA